MKLIFKIYKKVRDLKRQEIKLKRSILNLKKLEEKGWIDLHSLSMSGYIDQVKKDYEHKDKHLEEREETLAQREEELNEMQQKITDQILKLGIVKGLNK